MLVENYYAEEPRKGIWYLAGLGLISDLSKVTGVDNLINPPNAVLKSKMIFDVKIEGTEPTQLWVQNREPEPPKKEEKEEEKKP